MVRSSGQEEIAQVKGQERWPRGDTPSPVQGKRNPSKTVGVVRGHQRADMLKHNHRKLANLITQTTALLMKLSRAVWGHPRWTGHGGEV